MVPLSEDRVLSNTDCLMGAVMEARVNLSLGSQAITRCYICAIAAFFFFFFLNIQFVLSLLKKVPVKEMCAFWLS